MSSTKVIFNGLLPGFDSTEISGFKYNVPTKLQEKVLSNWKKYGFKS